MPYQLHCSKCDRIIEKGERFFEYIFYNANATPFGVHTLCLDDALENTPSLFDRFQRGNWTKMVAEWREA